MYANDTLTCIPKHLSLYKRMKIITKDVTSILIIICHGTEYG